jgi:hypothetical protein
VHFFNDFPRLGAYYAQRVALADGELRAVLCCDTVIPHGSGKKISEEDKDYVAAVAEVMAGALAKAEAKRAAIAATGLAKVAPQQLELALNPPPPEPKVEEEPAEEGAAEEAAAADEEGAEAAAEGEEAAEAAPAAEEAAVEAEEEEEEEEEAPEEEEEEAEEVHCLCHGFTILCE